MAVAGDSGVGGRRGLRARLGPEARVASLTPYERLTNDPDAAPA